MELAIQLTALVLLAAHSTRLVCSDFRVAFFALQTIEAGSLVLAALTLTYIHGL